MADGAPRAPQRNAAYYIPQPAHQLLKILRPGFDFCAFYRRPRDRWAPTNTPWNRSLEKARERVPQTGITELHIVGGLHPFAQVGLLSEMLRALRALDPRLHIKAFTAIEIRHLAPA